MSLDDDDQAREILSYTTDRIEDFRSELRTEPPPKRTAELHGYIASRARSIGLYQLLLGDESAAVDAFATAANAFVDRHTTYREYVEAEFDQTHWETETVTLLDALYVAVLSCDDESRRTAVEAATSVAEMPAVDHPANASRVNSVRALAGLLDEMTPGAPETEFDPRDAVAGITANLDEEEATPRAYFEALGVALAGIADEDSETVRRGLQALLDYHESKFDGEPETITERIDLRATAIARLAREHGLDTAIGSPYIADSVVKL